MRERSAMVFQDPGSQLVMSRSGDDVAFGLENRCMAREAIWSLVETALVAVGFPYDRDHPVDALSGGEQQRLALAGALALDPGLLLLDEPTANLDPAGAALVREALRAVSRQRPVTTVLVEHRLDETLSLVNRAIVLQAGGGVVADGSPADVFEQRGDQLATAGVWVPNRPLARPPERPRAGAQAIVTARGLGYRYPGAATSALEGVDLELRSSEALAVTGANGSGKSTLALLLGGLLRPSVGAVAATGPLRPSRADPSIDRWPAGRLAASIGSVFQDPEHQFLTGRVVDELALGPIRTGLTPKAAIQAAVDLMARLHLSHLADANPFTLSGGEKRRLSVATAIACRPAVLILDEPTFGQDRRTAVELLELLAALRDRGAAICFATHDAGFVAALADRTLHLEDGRTA